MQRAQLTEKILDIKREKGWSWKYICGEIGGFSAMLITAALLGQMKLTKPQAETAAKLFGLSKAEEAMLNEVPYRGSLPAAVPTDPLIYRFYELVNVYGTTWKELIQEEFGDGIMSAIDFDMNIERQPDQKGEQGCGADQLKRTGQSQCYLARDRMVIEQRGSEIATDQRR